MNTPFTIISPTQNRAPILVSVPHCGVVFPNEIKDQYKHELISPPDDTDFFVHNLYRFVSDFGATLIFANYSRWVIDLNRSAENINLYDDGRVITALTPTTDFLGNDIYISSLAEPSQEEVARRKTQYYFPYYTKITELLESLKEEFGQALLWDGHSIRRSVPTIQKDPFPDLILGTNDQKSADKRLISTTLGALGKSNYNLSHNYPFKGGNITRTFGDPKKSIHAIQLEMCKDLYMDTAEVRFDSDKAENVIDILKGTFKELIKAMGKSKTN